MTAWIEGCIYWCLINKEIHCRVMLILHKRNAKLIHKGVDTHTKKYTLLNVVCAQTNMAYSDLEWKDMIFYPVSAIEISAVYSPNEPAI